MADVKEKPSILFVDDQNNILQGFRRTLRSVEDVWTINYSSSGKEALKLMENTHVDIIISDTNMPGMRGTELLREVQSTHAETVRLVLSGGGSRSDDISILLSTSHQFFSKPFDIAKLKVTIERLLALRDHISDDRLKKMIAGISKLPCAPLVYEAFKKEREGSTDLEKMGAFIAQDPGLTAKMLQSLNSTFFGVDKAGIHPYKAAQSMGPGTIAYLFDENAHFHTIEAGHPNYAFLATMYRYSLQGAHLVEALATSENLSEPIKNISYTAGMMHEIGAIILACGLADEYSKLTPHFQNIAVQCQTEKKALGAMCSDVGAYFLGLWGFPVAIINAVAFSPFPANDPDQSLNLTTLVHVTRALLRADDLAGQQANMDMVYLEKIGMTGKLQQWHDLNKEVQARDVIKNWAFAQA